MKKHHTKNKGDLGVVKVIADLTEKEYCCYTSVSEHQPFDLIAYKNGKCLRIQVKFRQLDKTGKMSIPFKSGWSDKHGLHINFIDKNEIDLYAIYCPDTNLCYYLNPKKYSTTVSLRVTKTKNNQEKNILKAEDFLVIPDA